MCPTPNCGWRKRPKCIFDSDRRFEFCNIRDIRVRDIESRLYINSLSQRLILFWSMWLVRFWTASKWLVDLKRNFNFFSNKQITCLKFKIWLNQMLENDLFFKHQLTSVWNEFPKFNGKWCKILTPWPETPFVVTYRDMCVEGSPVFQCWHCQVVAGRVQQRRRPTPQLRRLKENIR